MGCYHLDSLPRVRISVGIREELRFLNLDSSIRVLASILIKHD